MPASRYQFARPTRDTLVDALERVFGPEQAITLWSEAASAIGADPRADLPIDALVSVCECLAARPGIPGVVGASLRIRCTTYRRLQELP